MEQCKNCRKNISDGNLYKCPNCNATLCFDCAKKLSMICPYCYSTLQHKG